MKKFLLSPQIKGYVVSNVLGVLIILLDKTYSELLSINDSDKATIIFSEFVIIPILMGIICAWFWRLESLNIWKVLGRSFICTLITLVLSYIALGERIGCLIVVAFLLFICITIGVFIGRYMFKLKNNTLNLSIVSLLLFIFFADARSTHSYQNMVADKIVIQAPPSKVWQYVVAYKKIEAPNKYWFFRLGLPSPVQSTATGYYVGANRKCIFSNGCVFDEKITQYSKNHTLTFVISNQPNDPEILGHIDILKGQFILQDNGNGTTTLTGSSWYALHVFPAWYYNLWAENIVSNVHVRVMERIKQLSEAK